jgi:hypothetical protein
MPLNSYRVSRAGGLPGKRRNAMSIGVEWITIEEAAAKYSLDRALLLKWVDEGLVRAEEADHKIVRVNVADLELEVQERAALFKE